MKMEVEVLSPEVNLCVIRMPDRRYPGILVQGDDLVNMVSLAKVAYDRANELGDKAIIVNTGNVLAKLETYLKHYGESCRGKV